MAGPFDWMEQVDWKWMQPWKETWKPGDPLTGPTPPRAPASATPTSTSAPQLQTRQKAAPAPRPQSKARGSYFMGSTGPKRPAIKPQGVPSVVWNNWGKYGEQWMAQNQGNPLQDFIEQFTTAFGKTQQAEQARFEEIDAGYGEREEKTLGLLEGYGTAAGKDIDREFTKIISQGEQGLVSSGLYNTSVRSSMRRGAAREKAGAMSALVEKIARSKAEIGAKLSKDRLAFKERPNRMYPDTKWLTQLAQLFGRSGR